MAELFLIPLFLILGLPILLVVLFLLPLLWLFTVGFFMLALLPFGITKMEKEGNNIFLGFRNNVRGGFKLTYEKRR